MADGVDRRVAAGGEPWGGGGSGLPRDRMTLIDEDEIEAQRTAKGGWTRDTLEAWGVPWPPPPGWKRAILETGIPYQETATTSPVRTARRKLNKLNRQVLCHTCYTPMRRTGESGWVCDGCGLRWP